MTLSKAAALARRAALRKIRDAERDEEKLKAEGKLEKRYRSQPYYCVACDGAPKRKMQCLYPPTCGEHVKMRNCAPCTQPEAVAEQRKRELQMARLERAQRLGPGGVHRMPWMTRARAAVGEALMIGVVALFCAAPMLGSQFRGPRWRHLFGIDVNPKFGPSFSLNNDGAPLLAMDILTLSVHDFYKLLASYAPGDMKYLLLVVTLDCGRASKANRTATNEEKRKFYMAAVAKVEELTKAAERKYNVFLFWEFVNCGFVLDLVEETFPEIDMITLEGHLFEDRERVFMSQRLDKGMELFEEELDSLVEAAGGESCAAAGLEGAGMEVPPGSKLFGSWTKKAYRQTHKGRDPWSRCAPTITKQGLWLVLPSGREIKITVEVLHYLRTAGGDWEFLFAPEDKPTLRRLILAMGVSTVVGSAARRSVERSVDGAAGGEIPKELL